MTRMSTIRSQSKSILNSNQLVEKRKFRPLLKNKQTTKEKNNCEKNEVRCQKIATIFFNRIFLVGISTAQPNITVFDCHIRYFELGNSFQTTSNLVKENGTKEA